MLCSQKKINPLYLNMFEHGRHHTTIPASLCATVKRGTRYPCSRPVNTGSVYRAAVFALFAPPSLAALCVFRVAGTHYPWTQATNTAGACSRVVCTMLYGQLWWSGADPGICVRGPFALPFPPSHPMPSLPSSSPLPFFFPPLLFLSLPFSPSPSP